MSVWRKPAGVNHAMPDGQALKIQRPGWGSTTSQPNPETQQNTANCEGQNGSDHEPVARRDRGSRRLGGNDRRTRSRGSARRFHRDAFQPSHKAIAAAWHRLYKGRILGTIAEG